MAGKKEEHNNNFRDNIKFEKELQVTTCYYTVLLLFAIIALFKIPNTNLKNILTGAYGVVIILTIFSVFYQIHIAVALWEYRNIAGINTTSKKVTLVFYTVCFTLLLIGA